VKKVVLVGALLALLAVAAEAQVTVEYNKKTRDSSLRVTYSGGYTYGYGYGYSLHPYRPGAMGPFAGGTLTFGNLHGRPCQYFAGYPAYGFHYGSPYGGYSYYSGPVSPYSYYAPYTVMDYSPPRPAVRGDRDDVNPARTPSREIEEGRRRLRAGDYRGALDAFREAVVADTSSASAQAWFALGLALTGDHRNADKALRAAAEHAPFEKIDLAGLFKDAREQARLLGILAKVTGEGALAAAWIRSLGGDPAPLRQAAEKDAAARKLLPP